MKKAKPDLPPDSAQPQLGPRGDRRLLGRVLNRLFELNDKDSGGLDTDAESSQMRYQISGSEIIVDTATEPSSLPLEYLIPGDSGDVTIMISPHPRFPRDRSKDIVRYLIGREVVLDDGASHLITDVYLFEDMIGRPRKQALPAMAFGFVKPGVEAAASHRDVLAPAGSRIIQVLHKRDNAAGHSDDSLDRVPDEILKLILDLERKIDAQAQR